MSELRWRLHDDASYEYGDLVFVFTEELQHLHEVVFWSFN